MKPMSLTSNEFTGDFYARHIVEVRKNQLYATPREPGAKKKAIPSLAVDIISGIGSTLGEKARELYVSKFGKQKKLGAARAETETLILNIDTYLKNVKHLKQEKGFEVKFDKDGLKKHLMILRDLVDQKPYAVASNNDRCLVVNGSVGGWEQQVIPSYKGAFVFKMESEQAKRAILKDISEEVCDKVIKFLKDKEVSENEIQSFLDEISHPHTLIFCSCENTILRKLAQAYPDDVLALFVSDRDFFHRIMAALERGTLENKVGKPDLRIQFLRDLVNRGIISELHQEILVYCIDKYHLSDHDLDMNLSECLAFLTGFVEETRKKVKYVEFIRKESTSEELRDNIASLNLLPHVKTLHLSLKSFQPGDFESLKGRKFETFELSVRKSVSDEALKSLEGVMLTGLDVREARGFTESGLSVVESMPLTKFIASTSVRITGVTLSKLAGKRMTVIDLEKQVKLTDEDMNHLKGMPLEEVKINGCKNLTDHCLPVFEGMPLRSFNALSTQINEKDNLKFT